MNLNQLILSSTPINLKKYIVSIRCITCKYAVALSICFGLWISVHMFLHFFTHDLFSVMGILMRLLSISADVNRCLLHTTGGQNVWSDSMIQEGGFWVADNHWVEHFFCKGHERAISHLGVRLKIACGKFRNIASLWSTMPFVVHPAGIALTSDCSGYNCLWEIFF